ncbi:copper-transporting ATPase PAA1, chloroplastic-like [Bidens hawaiensis]|uniref:copper-transporting ATPase PAA1, chloroplastic-like n=1 Tax=Bidens hawaiensis TaxID=980011 RepID=UPI004049011F
MEATLTTTTTTPLLLSFSKTLPTSTAIRRRSQLRFTSTKAVFLTSYSSHRRTSVAAFSSSVDDATASPSPSDVILLDVRGMMCGGCASSVKRILENQSQVSSASVDHTTETAIVWPVSEVKATPNWQKVIGQEIAKNLTNCGFDSNVKGEAAT